MNPHGFALSGDLIYKIVEVLASLSSSNGDSLSHG